MRAPLSMRARLPALVVLVACLWTIGANVVQGPLLSQDSESYLLLAQSLRHGRYALPHVETSPRALLYGRTHSPPPWPPIYPGLTALLSVTVPLALAARVMALLGTVLAVVLTAVLARRLGGSEWGAALAALVFATSPATVLVAPYLWSEPLFTVFVLLALILLGSPAQRMDRRALLIGLCAAAACLTRYNGVTLVAALAVATVVQERRAPLGIRLRHLLLVIGVPAIAVGGWLLRNRLVTGAFETYRGDSTVGLVANLMDAGKAIALTFAGMHPANQPLAIRLALLLLVLTAILLYRWRKDPSRRPSLSIALVLLFPAVHLVLLCVMRTLRDFDPLGPRLLWPALPALIAAAAAIIHRLLAGSPSSGQAAGRAFLAGVVALILVAGLLTMRQNVTHVIPQMRQEAQRRAEVAASPQLRPLVQGKRVLVVETWPITIAQAGEAAAALWGSSPYVFDIHQFDQPGPWRDWLKQVDVIVAIDPVKFNSPEWSQWALPRGAAVYVRR